MTTPPAASQRPYFWQRHTDGRGRWRSGGSPTGQDLAALRRGLGREAGEVPQMWPFYTRLREDGSCGPDLRAEHLALNLFAVHQQSKAHPMHQRGIGLGAALLAARRSGLYSPDGIDRRFAAAATATTLTELAGHLRGLINQLRAVQHDGRRGHPLDYTLLFNDLWTWQQPDRAGEVRRRWGSQYFVFTAADETTGDDQAE